MVIGLMLYVVVAVLMIGAGICQIKSQKPVWFYSGEQPPKEEELTDVKAWNKKHGFMWILYGIIIMGSFLMGMAMGENVLSVIPICGGVIIPIFIMMYYHHRLKKRYYK